MRKQLITDIVPQDAIESLDELSQVELEILRRQFGTSRTRKIFKINPYALVPTVYFLNPGTLDFRPIGPKWL
jgi:hypothetical protein